MSIPRAIPIFAIRFIFPPERIVIYSYEKVQLTDWIFILKNKTFESNKHRFQFCETFDERLIRLVPDRSSNLVVAEVDGNGVVIFEKDKQLYPDSDNG
jgi:hypothetical protein